MRILLTNARLAVRAGSELATLEFADAYRRNGHDVAIFTLVPGDLGREYARQTGVPVFGIADHAALKEFDPERLHVHHWPTVCALEWLGVTAPWIIGLLGSLEPMENPTPLMPGTHVPWWTLNVVGEGRYGRIPGWADSPHAIVGNWFDDSGMTRMPVVDNDRLRRVLVVSNRMPSSVYADLESVAATLDIEVTRVGLPDKSAVVDADLLRRFDGVVTIGRTTCLAMAAGVPVLVLDHFGADGWVTPDHIDDIARHNFSGRWRSLDPTTERLREWLAGPPGPQALRAVQEWAFDNATLTQVMNRIEVLHSQPCPSRPSEVFGMGSLAVGELLFEFESMRGHDVDQMTSTGAQRDQLTAVSDRLRAVEAQLVMLQDSKTFRWTYRLRQAYARLRAFVSRAG